MCAISSTVGKNYVEDSGLHRTLAGDGLAGIAMNAILPGMDYEFGTNEKGDTAVNVGSRNDGSSSYPNENASRSTSRGILQENLAILIVKSRTGERASALTATVSGNRIWYFPGT